MTIFLFVGIYFALLFIQVTCFIMVE